MIQRFVFLKYLLAVWKAACDAGEVGGKAMSDLKEDGESQGTGGSTVGCVNALPRWFCRNLRETGRGVGGTWPAWGRSFPVNFGKKASARFV